MKSNSFTTILIEAEEGFYLTQTPDVALKDRMVDSKIALGKFDSPENYKEITKKECDAITSEQEKLSRDG